METIYFNGVYINYYVKRRGTKNLYARLDDNGNVCLSLPYVVNKSQVEKFVGESYFKLIKRVNKKKKSIVNDEKIKILGDIYDINEIDNIDYLLTIKLKEYLKENYLDIASVMKIDKLPSIRLKKVKGYLGLYNKKNHQITLNILIGHLDKECVKYILIHELTHIKYLNHQKEFWDEVAKYLPDYKRIRGICKKEFVYYENY